MALAQHTDMPVLEIVDGMPIEANHVYVTAPNSYLRIAGNTCHLSHRIDLTTVNWN